MNEIVKYENNALVMSEDAQILMKKLDDKIAELTAQRDEIKNALLNAMIGNGVYKYETELMSVTAAQPVKSEFNAIKFKESHPELWDEYTYTEVNEKRLKDEYGLIYKECSTEHPIKPSLRIKYKG